MNRSSKTQLRAPFILPALAVALGSVVVASVTAQTFTVLHSFTATDLASGANSDGAKPKGLFLSDNTLYGTAGYGGTSANGTVFALNADGTGFTVLHNLSGSDGGDASGFILSGNIVYGVEPLGGGPSQGTLFSVNADGTGFTNFYTFTWPSGSMPLTNPDGSLPNALLLSGSTLYGTAYRGGSAGAGTVFSINADGTSFATLYSFSSNYDGAGPSALVLSGNTLYGTTFSAGSSGGGTLFVLNTDGSGFGVLHNFTANTRPTVGGFLSGNTLYGTLEEGGSWGSGAVFAINTDGTGFRTVYSFSGYTNPPGGAYVNSDGAFPRGALILSGDTLYGTTHSGGSSGNGTVFALSTDGTRFTLLHSFTNTSQNPYYGTNSDGADPNRLILSGNTLYGAAWQGGSGGSGTIFSISFPPQLAIVQSGTNVVLSWPTNYAGFDYSGYTLQSATNLGPATPWVRNSVARVVANGQFTVTNPVAGTQQFFRLSQ